MLRVACVLVALAACGSNADRCIPGAQRSCACANALIGVQVCDGAGAYGACGDCDVGDAREVDASTADAQRFLDAGRPTGATCDDSIECAGTNAQCTTDPGGYCSSSCNPSHVAADGSALDCPGTAYCRGDDRCYVACTGHAGAMPCRTGYDCFYAIVGATPPSTAPACMPSSYSACDPFMPDDCGGMTCVLAGPDRVGTCFPRCDPFAGCAPGFGCYVANFFGEGACFTSGSSATTCTNQIDCAPGLACYGGQCLPYCGGPSSVTCATGTCTDFSQFIPQSVVGVCVP